MADEETTTETEQPGGEASPETTISEERTSPETTPAVDDVAQLREEKARLEGEVAALRRLTAASTTPAAERKLDDLTPAELDTLATEWEGKIEAGEITAGRGARILGRIEATRLDRERQEQDRLDRPRRLADDKLRTFLAKYPALADNASDLVAKVREELVDAIAITGFDAKDPRPWLIAVERVVGGHTPGGLPSMPDASEHARRRIPVGGGGGPGGSTTPAPKAKTPGEALWERMTPAAQSEYLSYGAWRGSKEAVIKGLNHASPESIKAMEKAGRFK